MPFYKLCFLGLLIRPMLKTLARLFRWPLSSNTRVPFLLEFDYYDTRRLSSFIIWRGSDVSFSL